MADHRALPSLPLVAARVAGVVLLAVLGLFSLSCDTLLASGACSQDSDCLGDDLCVDGECVECERGSDCDDDEECDDGDCERVGEGEGEGEGEGAATDLALPVDLGTCSPAAAACASG